MCGISGFLLTQPTRPRYQLESDVRRMSAAIVHRGPDDDGAWVDESVGIALGHRRLSILDLSAAGHQPMTSPSGRYVMVFNGEIYNFRHLRERLEGISEFRGSSDTEVMLAAFDHWGLTPSVAQFNGMFSFAVWDRRERRLTLARDRCGEKPLYYGWSGSTFLFGSELKALRSHPAFRGEISRDSLALFMRTGYVPAPYTIYSDVWKLMPGTTLTVQPGDDRAYSAPSAYWSVGDAARYGIGNPLRLSDSESVKCLDSLLSDAVQTRMVADVPVGAFLSGGIDSTAVAAFMQKSSTRPVRTFTIGFREADFNEASDARIVAKHLGCDHTELYVTPAEAMTVIPRLPQLYDEPFADSSQIPTYLVSQLARQHVTVSLSGDGGDEVFGGYTRYPWANAIRRSTGWLPAAGRRMMASSIGNQRTRWLLETLFPLLPARLRSAKLADKLQKLALVLPAASAGDMYLTLVSQWQEATALVRGARAVSTTLTERGQWAHLREFIHRMMYLDSVTYLPDDILVKLDRASMGVSLESRVPFLDHRLIEFAWQLPLRMKVRRGQTKWLLKQVLYQYVPREMMDRPKNGFGVPLHQWLRGPLRGWAEELLDSDRLRREGFLDPRPIREAWAQHLAGTSNRMPELWNVLMFQAWHEHESSGMPTAVQGDRVSAS